MRRVITPQPEITLNHTDTFFVTGRDGQVRAGRQGLYHRDVRYLSRYEFTIDGRDPILLSANNLDFHLSRAYFTNPPLEDSVRPIGAGELVVVLDRVIDGGGMHEDWSLESYVDAERHAIFTLTFGASFEDVFQVRGMAPPVSRSISTEWDESTRTLTLRYQHEDYERSIDIALPSVDGGIRYGDNRIECEVIIAPRSTWQACIEMRFESGPLSHAVCMRGSGPRRLTDHHRIAMPSLTSDDSGLMNAWTQSQTDLTSLHFENHGGEWLPAAGVPWYAAIFGRDPLLTGYALAHANAGPLRATLIGLAELQAKEVDPWREAEPGKMPHELRVGELAHFRRIPHVPMYASADSTLLYVIALHEAWRWTGDEALVRRCLPVAERCMEWARRFGDRDGDGLQEYAPSPGGPGYVNMGWKDSPDAVVHADGSPATAPIALVELQGYWFDALRCIAELYEAFGRDASDLRGEAEALRGRVEERFWMEDEGTYAFALDGDKRPVRAIASNAGHLLWSGLPSADRARRCAKRLLAPDMWSGWGIRTLSANNPAYDPVSYHRGSVWPHDCALIAWGMRRFRLDESFTVVLEGQLAAAARFEASSLPELWSGISRMPSDFPVLYLDSNRPQAWAAASIALFVRALLGLEADPRERWLWVAPALPDWMGELRLERIPVLGARVSLRARGTEFEVLEVEGSALGRRLEVARADG